MIGSQVVVILSQEEPQAGEKENSWVSSATKRRDAVSMSALSPHSPCLQLSQDKNVGSSTEVCIYMTLCNTPWTTVRQSLCHIRNGRYSQTGEALLSCLQARSIIMMPNISSILPLQEICGFEQQQERFEPNRRKTYPNAQVHPILIKESVPSPFRKIQKQQLYVSMFLQKHTSNWDCMSCGLLEYGVSGRMRRRMSRGVATALGPGRLVFSSATWERSLFSLLCLYHPQPPTHSPQDQRKLRLWEKKASWCSPTATQESPSDFLSCFFPGPLLVSLKKPSHLWRQNNNNNNRRWGTRRQKKIMCN